MESLDRVAASRPRSPESASLTEALRRAVPWAVVGIALVAGVGVYFRFGTGAPFAIDAWWQANVGVTRGSVGYAIAVFMAEVGRGIGAAACSAVAAALLLARKRPRDAGAVITAMLIGVAGSEAIKSLALRPRPSDQLYSSTGASFPSGHAMGAAAFAVSLALVVAGSDTLTRNTTRWAWITACTWILVMMWSRTALHVHWFSDVLAGALLGTCAAVLGRFIWCGTKRPALPPPTQQR